MKPGSVRAGVPNAVLTPSSSFLFLPLRCKFFSLTETPEDYTVIVDEEGFKGGPRRVCR